MSCVGRATLAVLHDVKKSIFVTFLFFFSDECVTLLRLDRVRSDFQPGQTRSFMMCEDVFRLIGFMFRFVVVRLHHLFTPYRKKNIARIKKRKTIIIVSEIYLSRTPQTLSSKQRDSTGKRFFFLSASFSLLFGCFYAGLTVKIVF